MNLRLKKFQKVMGLLYVVAALITCISYFSIIDLELYEGVRRMAAISFAGMISVLMLLLAGVTSYFIKCAQRQICIAQEERALYKDYALKDTLTGAYSRLYYELKDSQGRYVFMEELHGPLTIILIDIDGFKYINDTYGHLTGDKVLQHLVHAIQDNITERDRLIRYGGDEFLLVLSSCDEAELDGLMAKIDQSINDNTVKEPLGISYGIYRLKAGEDMETAIYNADKMMYMEKKLKKS